jgi:hypothetical protein
VVAHARDPLDFLIDLPVQNHWENVDRVRTSVISCVRAVFADVGDGHTLGTVASELMENAMKYGEWPHLGGRVHIRIWGDRDRLHVQVENPIAAGHDVRELMDTIAWLNGFADPEDAYRERMLEIASAQDGRTRLGLARIAYEGRCKLAAEVDGETLRVTGVTTF